LKIHDSVTNELGILRLAGRLTVNEQPGLLKDAVASLVQRGARHVILDLSGVDYVDSTRLGELIAAHVSIGRLGGRLMLAGTPPRVLELLSLSSLAGVFERFDSIESATSSLLTAS